MGRRKLSEMTISKSRADVVSLTIDGKAVEASRDVSVLEVARRAGIYIPHLCDHSSIKPYAGCRLCLVQIEGRAGLDTSCTIPVAEGMIVRTDTPEIREKQRSVLEVILSDHPDRCLNCSRLDRCPPFGICQRDDVVTDRCVICPSNQQCELQALVDFLGLRRQRFNYIPRRSIPPEHSNPFLERNADYCIYCTRCARVCEEVRGIGALGPANRGPHDDVIIDFDTPLTETNCEFCGQCALVCPTGAIMKLDSRHGRIPEQSVATTCGYCGVGCGLQLNLRDGQLINVLPQEENPVNAGQLCVKGHFGYDAVLSPARLRQPMLQVLQGEEGAQRPASWDEALSFVAEGLTTIRERHGADAVGFIGSPKCTNEDNYLLQKIARAVIGTNNIDQVGRFNYAPNIEPLLAAFGAVGATNSIQDMENASALLVIGANVTETHTVLGLRVKRAVRKGAKLILVDPREVPLTDFAEIWLRPNPGTDSVLVNGLLRVIVDEGLVDEQYVSQNCEGLAELRESLRPFELSYVEKITGVAAEDIRRAACLFARGGEEDCGKPLANQSPKAWACANPASTASCIVYGSGVTQQVDAKLAVGALASLALITGNVGKSGAGVYPLGSENNTLGASDMGVWPDYLPGYRQVGDAAARSELAALWQTDLPGQNGLSMLEMLEGARTGRIKALYVMGSDLMQAAPDRAWVEQCLSNLELLVVQDVFPTATTQLAHAVLPGTSFAEKEGTFTNLERRVQRVRRAIEPLGDAKPDWQILCELGDRLLSVGGKAVNGGFGYVHPAHIMEEIARAVPQYADISYQRLEETGLQWPCPDDSGEQHAGTDILLREGFGMRKAHLATAIVAEPRQVASKDYPLWLITGGQLYHNATGTLSMQSKMLREMAGEAYLEMNPADAAGLNLQDGNLVRVQSLVGVVEARLKVAEGLPQGVVFLPVHFADAPASRLIARPKSDLRTMPSYKAGAVKVEKIG
jgi:formate dehydrogenase alpha subunit